MYRIRKTLTKGAVYLVCIENQYYTRGTNDEYCAMFSLLDKHTTSTDSNITGSRLYQLAKDIKDHSETNDTVEDIMSLLANRITCSLYIKEN